MPVFYVLLAGVSIPLASGVSAVLSRWLTLQVSAALCLASALLALALWGMAAAKMPGAAYAARPAAVDVVPARRQAVESRPCSSSRPSTSAR